MRGDELEGDGLIEEITVKEQMKVSLHLSLSIRLSVAPYVCLCLSIYPSISITLSL